MLVEMAIGDAYGAAFEFISKPYPTPLVNDTFTYFKHPELEIGNGRYTDDTQMTISIIEEMLAGPITAASLTDRFVSTFKRDPRKGYGKRFYELLRKAEDGPQLTALLDPTSTRSGAAMRAGPIGLYSDIETVLEYAALQARITHNSPEGIMSAQAVAAMSHFLAYRLGDRNALGGYLETYVPGWAWNDDWTDWASVQGLPCAHAAVTVVRHATSLRDALHRAIDVGGDVDTVAAIAMFAASLASDLENDLPRALYEGLESGQYGLFYLHTLNGQLFSWAEEQGAKL